LLEKVAQTLCWIDSLKDSKQNSGSHKTGKVFDQTCAGHDNAPADNEKTEINRRAFEPLEKNVAGNFK
jgi:hypothetical protein